MKKEKYQFVWREFGVGALIADLVLPIYYKVEGLTIYEKPGAEAYITQKEKDAEEKIGLELCQDRKKTRNLILKAKKVAMEAKKFFEQIVGMNLTEKSDKEMMFLFDEYSKKLISIFKIYFITEPYYFGDVERIIKKSIFRKIKDKKKAYKYFSILVASKDDKEIESIEEELNLPKEIKTITTSVRELGLMRIDLAVYWRFGFEIFDLFVKEIAKRKYFSLDQVSAMRFPELKNLLLRKKLPPLEILNQRKEKFVILHQGKKMKIITGKDADKYILLIRPAISIKEIKELKGNIANPGFAKGKVKVFRNIEGDLSKIITKMKKNDILVTEMTRPQTMPVVRKASAIITDEGGVNCHAAIISRELGIPCIIGTKIATKVLKDGDLVEVDANKGIVKILENNQKPIYEKVFTRDFSLPMLDVWYKGEAYDSKPWSGKKQAFLPYIVFVREDGTVKSYYDPRGVEWIKNHIKETIKKDKKFLEKLEKKVEEKLKPIQPIYDGEKTLSKKDLLKFIKNFEIAYPWVEAMWWLCEMDKNELRGLDISPIKKLRKKTTKLSTGTDIVVRKSLIKMFPKLKNYVHVLKIDEIKSEKIPKIPDLKKRDEGFIYTKNMMYIGSNRNIVEKKYNIKLETENIKSKDEIKGIVVYKGTVKGKVKRVMGHKHINLIKKGEILVSPMTMPDFLPAMKKASAFITDEGGLTCHAAIVAREMKKPCIVGTKIATKVLKDGDLVLVDTNKGIVKIIKEKNA